MKGNHLKIIPVIDVLNGIAVHAVRGERTQYRSLTSTLCSSADPLDVASTFDSLGFDSLYLADLDAIQGRSANFGLYQRIKTETSLDMMIDAGVSEIIKAEKVLKMGATEIIIGTETLSSLDFVTEAIKIFGRNRVIVSIDQKRGKVMSISDSITSKNPTPLAQRLEKIGVSQIILLDLDRVGTERGANVEILKEVLKNTEIKVLVGGGIRNLQDLEKLRALKVSGALVATALHNGKLKVDELKSAAFL